jgi:crossover junction endodeoxyribonuclease RuvC
MLKILAFDTSMSSPGAAVVKVNDGKAEIVALSHVKTNSKQSHGLRAEIIESWATLFIADNLGNDGFQVVAREDFVGRTSRQNHPVFSAWGAIDQALNKFGLEFTTPPISQSRVKSLVTGSGKAEKADVERAVRELTGYTGEFAADDESDAAAVALAYLIEKGVIKRD